MKCRRILAALLMCALLCPCLAWGEKVYVTRDGEYLDLEHVAAYLTLYGELPDNFLTKDEAKALGWVSSRGNLWDVAPGCAIGGDYFGNYQKLLPKGSYRECDVNYAGGYRDEQRLIFDTRGNLYFTDDHYNSFTPYTVDAAEGEEPTGVPSGDEDGLITEDGKYLDADAVAYYIAEYGHLPSNYLTKKQAKARGWDASKGNLWDVAPGCAIGGESFSNRDGLLPKGQYWECDVNYMGGYRGEERLVYDAFGHVYYTGDYFKTFELWYGEEQP